MSDYPQSPSVNPYWYYDPYGYPPNVSLPFNPNISVNTPTHPSFELYNHQNQSGHFTDSGYLSRTPTPPTPVRQPSPAPAPAPIPMRADPSPVHDKDIRPVEKPAAESKPRLPYVKRTRIQYTMQQLQILEEAFQNNHYPEVTTVDALAELLDVRHEKISIWFQNRRSRFKRQQKPKANATSTSSASSVPSTLPMTKKTTHPVQLPAAVPSPTYDAPTSYYPPYFWPSPIVDDRTAPSSYANHHLNSSFYDSYSTPTTPPMWNPNNSSYSSPSSWHRPIDTLPKMNNHPQ